MNKSINELSFCKGNAQIENGLECEGTKSISRIGFIDVAKTFCIFLMVVGHWTNNEKLWIYIYSFHMPALFVISGYLYKPRKWWKTIVSLGIPVLFYSSLNLLILCLTDRISVDTLLNKELFFRFFHYRYGLPGGLFCGDWFIWALLALRLLYGDVKIGGYIRKFFIPLSVLMIIWVSLESYLVRVDTIFRGWFIGRLVPCMPFFAVGLYLKEKRWTPTCISLLMSVALFLLAIALPIINGKCSILNNEFGLSYVIFCINAIITTILLFVFSNKISSSLMFVIFSKGTLLILGLNLQLIYLLDFLLPQWIKFAIPFLVMGLCYYPIILLDRWCPILLGKIK